MPGSAAAEPGPVGNEPLSFASPEGDRFLKVGLVEHDDYALVPAPVWSALEGWYGGGPAIRRPAVSEGGAGGRAAEVQLELTLLKLLVHARKLAASEALTLLPERGSGVLIIRDVGRVGGEASFVLRRAPGDAKLLE